MKKLALLFAFLCIGVSLQAQFLGLVGARSGSLNGNNPWFNNQNYYKSGWGYAIDALLVLGLAKYIYVKSGGRPLFFLTDNFEVFKMTSTFNNEENRDRLRAHLSEKGYRLVYSKRKNEDLFVYTKDGFDDVLQVKYKPSNKIRLRYVLTSKFQKNGLYAQETFTSLTPKHKSQTRALFGQKRRKFSEILSYNDKLLDVKKYILFLSGQDTVNVTRYTNTRLANKNPITRHAQKQ